MVCDIPLKMYEVFYFNATRSNIMNKIADVLEKNLNLFITLKLLINWLNTYKNRKTLAQMENASY